MIKRDEILCLDDCKGKMNKIEELYLEWFNSDLSNDELKAEAEKTLYKIGEAIKEEKKDKKGFFKIPSMVVSRDDLMSRFEGRDDEAEMNEKIENISDDDMQFIANKMTDMMMDDYWLALEEAYNSLLYWQEKEREKENE